MMACDTAALYNLVDVLSIIEQELVRSCNIKTTYEQHLEDLRKPDCQAKKLRAVDGGHFDII